MSYLEPKLSPIGHSQRLLIIHYDLELAHTEQHLE